tara:strand:- start:173 stop:661 length:489 start_codon:yes stop_codon:yes gene_type:complete
MKGDSNRSRKGADANTAIVVGGSDAISMVAGSDFDANSVSDNDVVIVIPERQLMLNHVTTQDQAYAKAEKLSNKADRGRVFKTAGGRIRANKGTGKTVMVDDSIRFRRSPLNLTYSTECGKQSAKGSVMYKLEVRHHIDAQPKSKKTADLADAEAQALGSLL